MLIVDYLAGTYMHVSDQASHFWNWRQAWVSIVAKWWNASQERTLKTWIRHSFQVLTWTMKSARSHIVNRILSNLIDGSRHLPAWFASGSDPISVPLVSGRNNNGQEPTSRYALHEMTVNCKPVALEACKSLRQQTRSEKQSDLPVMNVWQRNSPMPFLLLWPSFQPCSFRFPLLPLLWKIEWQKDTVCCVHASPSLSLQILESFHG